MAFSTGYLDDPQKVHAGERLGSVNIIESTASFQNLIVVGRFAQILAGVVSKMDGTANPLMAGVVLRDAALAVEYGDTIDNTLYSQIDYQRQGLCTVELKSGETPSKYGKVYASNAGDANDGTALATPVATSVALDAEFVEEVQTGVWTIRMFSGFGASQFIVDPGAAGAIPVDKTGVVPITTAGVETRTLANPSFIGQELMIVGDVIAGACTITAASGIDTTAHTSIPITAAGQNVDLKAAQVAGALVWRVVGNDGIVLA